MRDATAVCDCEQPVSALRRDVEELQAELEEAGRLGALLSLCPRFELSIAFPGDPAVIGSVTDGVAQLLRDRLAVVGHEFEIELALQEALANAVRHGCRCDATRLVECRVTYATAGDVRIVVRDPGPGFDAASVSSPLDGANLLKPGGRGLFLINQLMDEVRFADGGREIQMRKRHRVSHGGSRE